MSKDSVQEYYNQNIQSLEKMYPGLKLSYLEEVFEHFVELGESAADFISKISKGIPLEYLAQKKYFYDSYLYVDHRVLIPRNETEILIEKSISYLKDKQGPLKICEVGIGSGAIFLNIASHLSQKQDWVLTDISDDAIEVSKHNEKLFADKILHASFEYMKTDRLLDISGEFDFIVSNPPYIKENADSAGVHKQVIEFEPKVALFLGDNIYNSWFCVLFTQAFKLLKPGGAFFMEGHEDHLEDLKELATSMGYSSVEILKDYTQRDRFIHMIK
jgi:release factor glutamine methyltransferase